MGNDIVKPGKYCHYKGGEYEVIGVAEHTETGERLVVYKPLYLIEEKLCVRPLTMFLEDVEVNGTMVPRFKFIN